MKKTKIVATLGPASDKRESIEKLIDAGVNVFRLNFSHGSHEEHRKRLETVRAVAKEEERHIAVLQDLGGPKIRTGDFKTDTIVLEKESTFILTTEDIEGDKDRVSVNYKKLPEEVSVGGRLLLDDGKIELAIEEIKDNDIITRVVHGGEIRSKRGISAPGASLSIRSLTQKDIDDLDFSPDIEADFIALSFVRSAEDINSLKSILEEKGHSAHVVAKIETTEAVEKMDEIIDAADGIMVARGDLATEIPAEEVPFEQKRIIMKCRELGKPVIVATQMLESMTTNPVPTRAEVGDVANAILDGTDAVMLSGETAMGEYPIESVRAMKKVARRAESEDVNNAIKYRELFKKETSAIASVVIDLAQKSGAEVAVALTESGATVRTISRHRPHINVVALTPSEITARKLALTFAVEPIVVERIASIDEVLEKVPEILTSHNYAESGDTAILTTGTTFGNEGATNTIIAIRV